MAKEVRDSQTTNSPISGNSEPDVVTIKEETAKVVVLDRLIDGLNNGVNIEHCLTLSTIYKNLC